MFDSYGLLVAIAVAWVAIGLVLAIVMGRRGHSGIGWLVLGTMLGPFGIVLAIDAERHDENLQPTPLADAPAAVPGTGPVDVVVGYDGSPACASAIDSVTGLLGDRLGRLTVATVIPFGSVGEDENAAEEGLRRIAARAGGATPGLQVLHGHPSAALQHYAIEGGYQLIAVGTRGAGITKAILGSAASELARDSTIPVLLVRAPVNGLPS